MTNPKDEDLIKDVAVYLAAKDLQGWAFTRPHGDQDGAAEFERRRYMARAKDVIALVDGHRSAL